MEKEEVKLGRPTKYRPEFCEKVIEIMKEGATVVEVCAALGIVKDTFYSWCNPENTDFQPAFADAVKEARILSQAWWHKFARNAALQPNGTYNATLIIFNLKNRCPEDFRDMATAQVESSNGEGATSKIQISVNYV